MRNVTTDGHAPYDGRGDRKRTSMDDDTAAKVACGAALRAIIGKSTKRLGDALGVSDQTVRNWTAGQLPDEPAKIFAIETALADLGYPVNPGDLSSYLGYLPLGASDTERAILADPDLPDDEARRVMLDFYRTIVRYGHRDHR